MTTTPTFFKTKLIIVSLKIFTKIIKDAMFKTLLILDHENVLIHGGHKPGKLEYSGISLNMENSGNFVQPQGKIIANKVFLARHSNICVKQLMTCCVAGVDVE